MDAGAKMSQFATPKGNRCMVIDSAAEARTVDGLKALFHSGDKLASQYTEGQMGRALGFDFFSSENVPRITSGTRTGTVVVDGTVSTEGTSTVHVDGFTSAAMTVAAGEVLTIAGVYAVNPVTKQSTGVLQDFVVTETATSASNEVDLTVSPKIYTSASGGLQTVDSFPQDGAAVTFKNTTASTAYPVNVGFAKDAYTFASANLEMPSDVSFKSQQAMDGINIRILRQYDINSASFPTRLDIFYGSLAQYPSQACRIIG